MSTAHTHGPWSVNPEGIGECVVGSVDRMVCECYEDGNTQNEEDLANARLIAAAPELLDALNGLYGLLQLFAAREDVPPEVKNFATNHRAVDALAVLAKVES